MNVKELYCLLEKECFDMRGFLTKIEFCMVNERINMMIENINDKSESGKVYFGTEKLYAEELEGEIFFIFEKSGKIGVINCENKKELQMIIEEFKFNDDIKRRMVIRSGKKIAGGKRNKEIMIKEAAGMK